MPNASTFFKFWLVLSFLAVPIGFRLSDVGADSSAYQRHFQNSSAVDGIYERFEPGFSILMQVFSKSGLSSQLFFACLALFVTLAYSSSFSKIYSGCFLGSKPKIGTWGFYFSFLMLSSWYFAATTNGLRQGLSLAVLYLSVSELIYSKRRLRFLLYFGISVSFHYSTLLLLPFIWLLAVRYRYLLTVWLLVALGYFLGVNEFFVKFFSEVTGLPLYEAVKFYALEKGKEDQGGGLYEGFIMKFFLYTLIWPILLNLVLVVKKKSNRNFSSAGIKYLIKIYLVCSLVYLFLGFGAFSNRYAFIAWFLVPIIQVIALDLFLNLSKLASAGLILAFFSITYFWFFQLNWIGLITF